MNRLVFFFALLPVLLLAEIREATHIADIFSEVRSYSIVLMDIDETLIESSVMLGGKAWRDYAVCLLKTAYSPQKVQNLRDKITYWIAKRVPCVAVETVTPSFLDQLKEKQIPVFGFTSRGKQHWNTIPCEDGEEIACLHLKQARCDLHVFSQSRSDAFLSHPSFGKGIFFAKHPFADKGSLALEVFAEAQPAHVLFVDDSLDNVNSMDLAFTQLELFLLDQAPTCLATQQRFEIFKREIQTRLHDGVILASIPCGLTADLLDLDFSQISHFSIYGIDIDPESLIQSQQIAENLSIAGHCQFVQRDAWTLGYEGKFDVITSNGLSIYEPDNTKIVALYHQFFLALKPNGCLVTSFLTPPPIPGTKTEWDLKNVNSEHALLQKIVFADVLECKWQIFRSEELVRSQLLEAGFTEIEVFYDEAHIFPTVIARKV
jgi:hypothetical protein